MSVTSNRRRFLATAASASAFAGMSQLGFSASCRGFRRKKPSPTRRSCSCQCGHRAAGARCSRKRRATSCSKKSPARIHKGTSYREVLAALLLAGVRNVQPRPSVGFKFHAVLVVNSAHLASICVARRAPLAADLLGARLLQGVAGPRRRGGQLDDGAGRREPRPAAAPGPPGVHRRDGQLGRSGRRRRRRRPGPHRRRERALRHVRPLRLPRLPLDRPQGDLRRQRLADAQLHRLATLPSRCCGRWPTPCSNHEGGEQSRPKATSDADRPGRENVARAKKLRADWQTGTDRSRTRRTTCSPRSTAAAPSELCDQVVETLNRGVSPQSVWDALLVGSGELLMRQPGIVGLHTLTTHQRPALRLRHVRRRRDAQAAAACRTPRSCRCSAAR